MPRAVAVRWAAGSGLSCASRPAAPYQLGSPTGSCPRRFAHRCYVASQDRVTLHRMPPLGGNATSPYASAEAQRERPLREDSFQKIRRTGHRMTFPLAHAKGEGDERMKDQDAEQGRQSSPGNRGRQRPWWCNFFFLVGRRMPIPCPLQLEPHHRINSGQLSRHPFWSRPRSTLALWPFSRPG